jgi:hypothetical protein
LDGTRLEASCLQARPEPFDKSVRTAKALQRTLERELERLLGIGWERLGRFRPAPLRECRSPQPPRPSRPPSQP